MRATVYEVKKAGSRVKVILSRTKPQLVQRLFEQEIPEIAEGVIEIRAIAREPGYRTKVAVSSTDQRVDCVGACVGVRGNRIKNIVDELAGERIDIVRYSDDMQVLIPNALQPAEVEEVILCQMLGRAIVLVQEDQLSLAIGRRGQNVRLASKLCGWDIEIMTREELDEQIEQAVAGYSSLEGVESELAERLVGEGFLSYDDLSVIEPEALMEMGSLTAEQADVIVRQAELKAAEAEKAAAEQRRQQREQERLEAAEAAEAAANQSAYYADGKPAEVIEQAAEATAPAATRSRPNRTKQHPPRRPVRNPLRPPTRARRAVRYPSRRSVPRSHPMTPPSNGAFARDRDRRQLDAIFHRERPFAHPHLRVSETTEARQQGAGRHLHQGGCHGERLCAGQLDRRGDGKGHGLYRRRAREAAAPRRAAPLRWDMPRPRPPRRRPPSAVKITSPRPARAPARFPCFPPGPRSRRR